MLYVDWLVSLAKRYLENSANYSGNYTSNDSDRFSHHDLFKWWGKLFQ